MAEVVGSLDKKDGGIRPFDLEQEESQVTLKSSCSAAQEKNLE